MLDLIFFDDIIFVDGFHGKDLFGFFSFDKKDSSKGTSSKDDFGGEIIEGDLLFKVLSREEGFSGSSDHFPFLFFALKILLISGIIMRDIFAFEFFWTLLFFLLFGGGIVNQAQLILIIDRQFFVFNFPVGPQDIVYDLLSSV
jgi:hypothetical protein